MVHWIYWFIILLIYLSHWKRSASYKTGLINILWVRNYCWRSYNLIANAELEVALSEKNTLSLESVFRLKTCTSQRKLLKITKNGFSLWFFQSPLIHSYVFCYLYHVQKAKNRKIYFNFLVSHPYRKVWNCSGFCKSFEWIKFWEKI